MRVFVIADTHFWHKNIIDYCDRPFNSVEEMNSTLIKNWNKTVTNNDIVIHLGDVGLGPKEKIAPIVQSLKGIKILIMGNHDNLSEQAYRDMGFWTVSRFPIVYDGFYIMSHAPIQLPNKTCYKNIYGHVHNDPNYVDTPYSQCVSVERINYTPFLLYEKE